MERKRKKITVFTPTFNRAYKLDDLYESLLKQTEQNFIWLIVDDGSTDNTEEKVKGWIKKGEMEILYYFQENAGKMQAHNKAVLECRTELFLCVDSDDYLVEDAIEKILKKWLKRDRNNMAGIIAYKGDKKGQILGKGIFPNIEFGKLGDLIQNGFLGDTTICFNTDILRKYLFPKITGEKFITEAFIYKQIDQKFDYYVYPCILTICEYLEDGYSKKMEYISYENPIGRMYFEAQNLYLDKRWKEKVVAAIRYDAFKRISGYSDVRKFNKVERLLLWICYPLGMYLANKKDKRYTTWKKGKKDDKYIKEKNKI